MHNELNLNERNDTAQDELLKTVLERLGGGDPVQASSPTQNSKADQSAAVGGGSGDILSSLLSNPELIAKLPTIISSIKPIIEMFGKSSSPTVNDTASVAALPQKAESVAASVTKADRGGSDSRTALLCAMKPYLSADRRDAIDYIVKLGRLGDILKTL